ncbi:MAG: hypothetical protein AB7I04_18460 [Pseudomonadales bacterium]
MTDAEPTVDQGAPEEPVVEWEHPGAHLDIGAGLQDALRAEHALELAPNGWGFIQFQRGNPETVGRNGVFTTELLGLLRGRIERFQEGPMACEENATALELFDDLIDVFENRVATRKAQGVYGEEIPHKPAGDA